MKHILKSTILLSLSILTISCEKHLNGVCEMRWGTSSYSYYCQPEGEEYCSSGWERYFSSASCNDLGYTEKHKGEGGPIGIAFVSSEGRDYPGENGYFATGSGGTGSGSSGGSVNCNIADYDGPEFDIQVDAQCKAAYLYDCGGDIKARNAACKLYYDYGNEVWTGSGSLPKCPYCN